MAIATIIDGGDAMQDGQKEITSIVDETSFALRRKGTDWAKNIAVLMA